MHKAWSGIEEVPHCFLMLLFPYLTPVLIHRYLWKDGQSLKGHRRGALLSFKVIRQISKSHGSKNRFGSNLSISIWPLHFEFMDGLCQSFEINNSKNIYSFQEHGRGSLMFLKAICQISRSHRLKYGFGTHLDYKASHSYQIPQINLVLYNIAFVIRFCRNIFNWYSVNYEQFHFLADWSSDTCKMIDYFAVSLHSPNCRQIASQLTKNSPNLYLD